MDHIRNIDRFNQPVDFSTFPCFASDVDGVTHALGKCWLWQENKVEGTGVPVGQEIFIKDLVRSLGITRPAFYAIAHHDTRPTETITGDSLFVSKVYASAPWVDGRIIEHIYTDRPTWSNFAADVLLVTGGERVLHSHPTFLAGREQGDILDKLDGYLWRAVENERLMQEYAELDFVDREDMSDALWAFVNSFGFADGPEDNIVQLFEALVFNNWLANRHLIA